MKKLLTILIILLIVPFVYAGNETTNSEGKELCDYIFAKTNIEIGTSVPKMIPYKNERFNVFTNQDEPVGHLIFEDGLVTSYNCEQIEEPTYNVIVVGKSTIDDIRDSESPIKALNEKLGNKEIDLNGVTFGKQFKGFITKLSLSIASIFM